MQKVLITCITSVAVGYTVFYGIDTDGKNDDPGVRRLRFQVFLGFVVLLILILNLLFVDSNESYANLTNEAINNIASIYNTDNMTVTNLTVTGKITTPAATIGNWEIRNDSIGIPGRKDIHMTDWVRIYDYNTNKYSSTGVAATSFWEGDTLSNKYVAYKRNVSAKPINDYSNCFDFGSDHRTTCNNSWSIVQMIPR